MYTLTLEPGAQSDLRRLDAAIRARIFTKLNRLCVNCDNHPHTALKGRHSGKFSLKNGAYRALYTFDRRTREIIVHEVGHRSKIY